MSRFDKRIEHLEDEACINKKVVVIPCGADDCQMVAMQAHLSNHPEDRGAETYVFIIRLGVKLQA